MKYFKSVGLILIIIVLGAGSVVTFQSIKSTQQQEASLFTIQTNPVRACNPAMYPNRPGTNPWIQVISPNGGESYHAGQQVTITWSSCNLPSSQVDVELFSPLNSQSFSLGRVTNTGSMTVTMPSQTTWTNMIYGQNFEVVVTPTTTGPEGSSANLFSINAALATNCQPGFAICVSQNGGTTTVVNAPSNGGHGTATMKIPLEVTAGSRPIYIPSVAVFLPPSLIGNSSYANEEYVIDNAGTAVTQIPSGNISTSLETTTNLVSSMISHNGNFYLQAGQTIGLELFVTYTPSVAGSYRMTLMNVPWSYSDATTTTGNSATGFLNILGSTIQFKTPYVSIP